MSFDRRATRVTPSTTVYDDPIRQAGDMPDEQLIDKQIFDFDAESRLRVAPHMRGETDPLQGEWHTLGSEELFRDEMVRSVEGDFQKGVDNWKDVNALDVETVSRTRNALSREAPRIADALYELNQKVLSAADEEVSYTGYVEGLEHAEAIHRTFKGVGELGYRAMKAAISGGRELGKQEPWSRLTKELGLPDGVSMPRKELYRLDRLLGKIFSEAGLPEDSEAREIITKPFEAMARKMADQQTRKMYPDFDIAEGRQAPIGAE